MKLFTKVMAAALLSTAISGAVLAAGDIDFGGGTMVAKAGTLVDVQTALGIADNHAGTAQILTLVPGHLKAIMAVNSGDLTDADAAKTVKTFQTALGAVVAAADATGDQLDNAVAALGTAGAPLVSKEFAFDENDAHLGINKAYFDALAAFVSPDAFKAAKTNPLHAVLDGLVAAKKDGEAGAGSKSKYKTLKDVADAYEAIEAKAKSYDKKADATGSVAAGINAEYTDLYTDLANFKAGKSDVSLTDLVTKVWSDDVTRAKYDKKKVDLIAQGEADVKKALAGVAPTNAQKFGEAAMAELIAQAGKGKLKPLQATAAMKALGLAKYDAATLEAADPAVLAKAVVDALIEMNQAYIKTSSELRDAKAGAGGGGAGGGEAGRTTEEETKAEPVAAGGWDLSSLPQMAQDSLAPGATKTNGYVMDPATGAVTRNGKSVGTAVRK